MQLEFFEIARESTVKRLLVKCRFFWQAVRLLVLVVLAFYSAFHCLLS